MLPWQRRAIVGTMVLNRPQSGPYYKKNQNGGDLRHFFPQPQAPPTPKLNLIPFLVTSFFLLHS